MPAASFSWTGAPSLVRFCADSQGWQYISATWPGPSGPQLPLARLYNTARPPKGVIPCFVGHGLEACRFFRWGKKDVTKFNKLALALLAASAFTPALDAFAAGPIQFNGYFRSGVARYASGGDFRDAFGDDGRFGINGMASPGSGRLGNEPDDFFEIGLGTNLYETDAGGYAKVYFMFASGNHDNASGFEGVNIAIEQLYAEVGNVFGGALEGANFWVGKRFYQRHDIHLNDFYYWNNSGPGGGVQDINVGFGKMHFAYFQESGGGEGGFGGGDTGGDSDTTISIFDLRFTDIATNPDGNLTIGLEATTTSLDESSNATRDGDNGFAIHLIHFQNGFAGGFNKFAFQAGFGLSAVQLGKNFKPYITPRNNGEENDRAFRINDQVLFQLNENINGMAAVYYQHGGLFTAGKDGQSFGVVARPIYHFNDNFGVAVEVGYDYVDFDDAAGTKPQIFKATVAPIITAGRGFFNRPELRAFVSYFNWNDDAQIQGTTGSDERDETDDVVFGLQADAFW
jgi:maltoporin